MDTQRVTIRQVETEAIEAVRATAKYNNLTLGEATSEAFYFWIESLDPSEDTESGLEAA